MGPLGSVLWFAALVALLIGGLCFIHWFDSKYKKRHH